MRRRVFFILSAFLPWIAACAAPVNDGPGMIVTFRNVIKGKTLLFDDAVSTNGIVFPNPGGLAPESDPMQGGKTQGSAPDGLTLPEWVEFTWREPNYKEEHTYEQLKAMPRKTGRVMIRNRVPQDVVGEVIESNRRRERSKTPDKMLWVYFIWYENDIKFRWELKKDCCTILREGGDPI